VLAGGEYGGLVRKMGKAAGAVGFAVYLDMLEELSYGGSDYDVDVLIVYDESASIEDILDRKAGLIAEGKSVSLQRAIPEKLRYKELVRMEG
jgi:ATP phosphoribosyltransferase regulatory subunit